jgi:hypothetical protein
MKRQSCVKKYLWLAFPAAALLLYGFFRLAPAAATQVYSLGLYKWLSQGLSMLAACLPFSIAELLVVLLVLAVLYGLGKLVWLCIRGRNRLWPYIKSAACNLFKWSVLLLSAFICFAGVHYHRVPLSTVMGLDVGPSPKEDLFELCLYLRDQAQDLAVPRGKNGAFLAETSFFTHKKQIAAAYDSLAKDWPLYRGYYPSTKALLSSHWFSYTYTMGIFSPFTMEANVNKDVPEFVIPAVMAHEQAHLRGLMREDEAEFTVFLLAQYSENIAFVYSCYCSCLMRALGPLYRADAELHKQLVSGFSPELLQDFSDYADYWEAFRSPVGKAAQQMNNAYLKANSQADGVQSYGRVVDLMLAYKKVQDEK